MNSYPPALSNLLLINQGKTRDTFAAIDPHHMLIVATDRLSTHNVVHQSKVPKKGEVLTALTVFWFKHMLPSDVKHHLVASGPRIYEYLPKGDYPDNLHHRAIVVKKLEMIPVEFIFRAYMTGSLWKAYRQGGSNPYGIELPSGMKLMSQFDPLIFTPTDKSESDDPLKTSDVILQYGSAVESISSAFNYARQHLNDVGIELVDSKFEVGLDPDSGAVVIGDEFATPDSSRFCERGSITEGFDPPWLDKQLARDIAERVWGKGDKVPLIFEPEALEMLSATYLDIFRRVTGMVLEDFQVN